jgi:hypothetical protein
MLDFWGMWSEWENLELHEQFWLENTIRDNYGMKV